LIRHNLLKISPNPSFPKREIPPFRKGREEEFSLQRPYNYGLISKLALMPHRGEGFVVRHRRELSRTLSRTGRVRGEKGDGLKNGE